MSELSDLVGVLGAIDDHLVEHPEQVPEVGQLLRPYQQGALGWFPVFRRWLAERPAPEDEAPVVIPGLDDALGGLADVDDEAARTSDFGLRLLTIAVLGRVMPDYGSGGANMHHTLPTLTIQGLAADQSRADQLLRLLTDSESYPDASAWAPMMNDAVAMGLIPYDSARPLRCQSDVVQVTVAGHVQPATALTTTLVADDLTFADASAVLDPAIWPRCCSIWCGMTPANPGPDGSQRFVETISIDCPKQVLTTCLGFKTVTTPLVNVAAYRLSPPTTPDCPGDGEVLVDEGSIEVHDRTPRPGVSVTTTKRVLFKSVPPDPLTMFACLFGYGDMGQLLVYEAARLHRAGGGGGMSPMAITGKHPPARADEPGHDCNQLIHEVATVAKECVEDTRNRYRKSNAKVIEGTYTSDDAAADAATVLKRTARDWATAVDLGLRSAGIVRRGATEPPAGGEDPE
jgi:hypothetical protein